MDEAMVPTDYLRAGLITDDKLKAIFTKLRKEASCMIFMDCCHSGAPHPTPAGCMRASTRPTPHLPAQGQRRGLHEPPPPRANDQLTRLSSQTRAGISPRLDFPLL